MKTRAWWIIQRATSYFIGEPVYAVYDEEPGELTKRTSAAVYKVVSEGDYLKLMYQANQLASVLEPVSNCGNCGGCQASANLALKSWREFKKETL